MPADHGGPLTYLRFFGYKNITSLAKGDVGWAGRSIGHRFFLSLI
jgi:hypothetical protein